MKYISEAPILLTSSGKTSSVCIWLYTVCTYSLHAPVIKYSWTTLLFLCDGCVCVSTVDCVDPLCSGRGVCVRGECVCSAGWGGESCETALPACKEQCSGHGTYQAQTGGCVCEQGWSGDDCSVGEYQSKHTDIQMRKLFPFILSFVIIVLKVLLHHLVMCLSLRSF